LAFSPPGVWSLCTPYPPARIETIEVKTMTKKAIHDVAVFDGVEKLKGKWCVVVDDGRIEKLIPAEQQALILGDGNNGRLELVDGSGCTLLPGLIDLHVHLTWSSGVDPVTTLTIESPELTLLRAVGHASRSLKAGITTVRDLGSVGDMAIPLAKAIESGWVDGPRVVASGRTIIMTGGHDPFHGLMIDGPNEATKAVRHQVYIGAEVIKISETGGVYGRPSGEAVDDVELLPEELEAITRQAHHMGRKVTAHCIGEQGIDNCIAHHVDCIEHGHYLTRDQAKRMAAQGMALVPTLFVYKTLAEVENVPEYTKIKAKKVTERHHQAIQHALEAGVLIGAGSDAGSPQTDHPSLMGEIRCLAQYGLAAPGALTAATFSAAKILGLDRQIGRVAPGYRADLILVDGDPTADIERLTSIRQVWKDGVLK
jgi:imidazolonepropionase-like amidohydrolase